MRIFLAMVAFAMSTVTAIGQSAPVETLFTIVISTEQSTFKSGDAIPVTVKLTNTSNEDLNVSSGVDLHTGILSNHLFQIRNELGEIVGKKSQPQPHSQAGNDAAKPEEDPTGPETSKVIFGALKPGEHYSVVDDISRAFDLSRPGKYTIAVSHHGKSKGEVVKSNVITITITP